MRKTLSLLTAALVVTGLAACSSSSGEPSASSTPTAAAAACENVKAGDASKSVKVEGAFRKAPTVSIPSPLNTSDIERSVVITGTGQKAQAGASVDVALAAYNGTTGKELTPAAGFDDQAAQTVTLDDKQYVPGLVRAVECLPVGSRVVLTAPAKDAFGSADISQLSLTDKDSVVFVADLVDVLPTKANGTTVEPPAGLPKVTLAKSGEPTIAIPKTDPPTETKIAVLKQGDGDTVQANDTVTIQYKGALWRNGKVFDATWTRGQPYTNNASQFVPGFTKALIGQKVGSQVIAVIPPADGYGSKGNGDIKGTDTMVFVVDVLKTVR
ncbi:FKBP-type peptidyl-prolyl cis-trans isomerase [Leifsonia sp. F6_8S_P_1B]|uniref:peptidylprolyl isomerase n=1 Tax=Leifsonia williamsii TaxID=3035919 RepID=A0ABT8KCK4_9MICO|nr:FKBP-type peptidyl-prolyl cis-trans isomerase [Leifsonia williamsii]MDN4615199.1 FKBP-type peptidyl-prolyl cis-trans isomerase [Leifsonia williamsii]